jgi:hypothetical protein
MCLTAADYESGPIYAIRPTSTHEDSSQRCGVFYDFLVIVNFVINHCDSTDHGSIYQISSEVTK